VPSFLLFSFGDWRFVLVGYESYGMQISNAFESHFRFYLATSVFLEKPKNVKKTLKALKKLKTEKPKKNF